VWLVAEADVAVQPLGVGGDRAPVGFRLGADTFFSSKWLGIRVPFDRVRSGWMTTRQYMDHYARDEYAHGLSRNPEFVTLIRSLDGPWSHPEGFTPLDAAPVTWVGDNRHTWKARDRGIEAALRDILASARLGYCVIGSDVAGYHGRSNPDDISPSTSAMLDDYIRGVDTVDDPYYGTSQHANTTSYHWTDGYGTYRNSNDATYDPNQNENGDWRLMPSTR
jgi:hypothetical protein